MERRHPSTQPTTTSARPKEAAAATATATAAQAPTGAAAVEALALLKVVATQLQGPSGAALREAIASRSVPATDLQKVAGLAQALAGLVEPSPSPSPPPPPPSPPVLGAAGSSSSGLTTLASSDSLLSSCSSASSAMLLLNEQSMGAADIDQDQMAATGSNSTTGGVNATSTSSSDSDSETRTASKMVLTTPPRATTNAAAAAVGPTVLGTKRRQSLTASAVALAGLHQHPHLLSPPSSHPSSASASPPTKKPHHAGALPFSSFSSTSGASSGKVGIQDLPDGTLLSIFDLVWSGRPSYNESDGRKQLGDIALVCRQWRDLAHSDELWKPLCIARWPWLKSLKGGPAELLPPLAAYKYAGEGRSPQVWHEFCVRHGRTMARAGIGRRATWGTEYSLAVEIFDRKGGFRLFCSYGRLSVMQQAAGGDGRWLTKLAITGFASCWHFSAATRDPDQRRFASVREYFERAHEKGVDNCICTEVTVMNKETGKMALLYASSKEAKRRFTGERNGVAYFEEELRPASTTISHNHARGGAAAAHTLAPPFAAAAAAAPPNTTNPTGAAGGTELISYLAGSGMAVSKVVTPGAADPTAVPTPEEEQEQKYRVDRLYLVFSTTRRWDVNKIFAGLDWA